MKVKAMRQAKAVEGFYVKHGKCCAGCDNWRYFSATIGECVKSNLMGHEDRISLLGFKLYTGPKVEAEHAITPRDFLCGNFHDSDLK
jgi:hypothetical protein